MKNREKLLNMAMYDLLRKIENYVYENICIARLSGRFRIFCIQEVFDERFSAVGETSMREHRCSYVIPCEECLQKWLNEEVET